MEAKKSKMIQTNTIRIDIEKSNKNEYVYGITLDSESSLYITDNYMITHNTQDFATDIQQILIKKFTLIRSKSLFVILIIPNPFMLRRYFLVFRTKFLIHCYSPDGISRGFAKFYSFKRKKDMYFLGFKTWNMNVVQPNFMFRFTDTLGWFVNTEAYEIKKKEAVDKLTQESGEKKDAAHKKQILDLKTKFADELAKAREKNNTIDLAWKQKYIDLREENKKKLDELKSELKDSGFKRVNMQLQECKDERDKLAAYVYSVENLEIRELSAKLKMEHLGLFTEKKLKDYIEHGKMLIELYRKIKS
jgi:hypothetical protein